MSDPHFFCSCSICHIWIIPIAEIAVNTKRAQFNCCTSKVKWKRYTNNKCDETVQKLHVRGRNIAINLCKIWGKCINVSSNY